MDDSRSGAGGKIVANRRKQRLAATPYDRPPPSPAQPTPVKSPSWFSGVIVPSARAIASGAGKIISSVLYTESESSSEDEDNLGDGQSYEIPCDGANIADELTETKDVIEQLIMQETFSSDECDSLTKVLQSRVVNCSMEAENRLAFSPRRNLNDSSLNDKAVLEAKKWFQEKKAGSSLLERGDKMAGAFNIQGPENLVESAVDSPVDVARSYMRARPPWTSATKHNEFRTPSSPTLEFFKEGTSYSVGHDSLSSLKRQSSRSLASGSWNIQEELRRVRLKATEDMLQTPSSKFDPSMYAAATSYLESEKSGEQSFGVATPISLKQTQLFDVPMDSGVSSYPGLEAVVSRQDVEAIEPLSSKLVAVSGNKDLEAVQNQINGECSSPEKYHSDHPNKNYESAANKDSEIGERQCVNGIFSSSQASDKQNDGRPSEGKHDMDKKKSASIMNLEGNCELLTEAFVEIPIIPETDRVASSSQNSFGKQHEEMIRPSTEAKIDKLLEEQEAEKSEKSLPRVRRSRRKGK